MKTLKFKPFFRNLFEFISYSGVDDADTPKNKDFNILLNQYLSSVFIVFFVQSISILYFLGFRWNSVFLLLVSLLFLICIFYFRSLRRNKLIISIIFSGLSLIITYYASLCALESGVFIFYFPLISAIPIFFNYKEDKKYVIFLIIFILVSLYVSAITGFTLVKHKELFGYDHVLLIINISCMLIFSGLNFFFLEEKKVDYYFALKRNSFKQVQIENLNNEVLYLKELLAKENFTEETLEELINSIQLNDSVFIEKFDKLFPDFFDKLKGYTLSDLTLSDLKYCAMLKLGFTTKQIATYTDSSMKSVEGKKYRLRKKFNIPADIDSKLWFSDIKI